MALNPTMNAAQNSILTTGAAGTAMWASNPGLAQNTISAGGTYNINTMEGMINTCTFTVEKVDNGFVLRSGSKAKVCKDMNELRDFFVSIMVEYQMDK
jgi:hypothetical protein